MQTCRNDENDDWVKANAKADVGVRGQCDDDDGCSKTFRRLKSVGGQREGARAHYLIPAPALGT